MQFNEKLKSLRTKKGISQAELAKNIFVSRSAVAKWENGLGLPSEESLKLLAEYFDVPISELQSDPIGEDIVIQKNSKLSKQKILITVLAVFLVIAAVLSAVFISLNSTVHDEYYESPMNTQLSPGRGLMFTTEKKFREDFSSYSDDELTLDKEFSPSRVFLLPNLPNDYPQVTLPKLVMETAKRENGTSIYEEVKYDELTFYATEGIKITCSSGNGWRIYINLENPHQAELTGFVNIKYGNEILSIKLVKVPTPVESVKIQLKKYVNDDLPENSIPFSKQAYILADVLPYGATYSDYSYTIEKIEKPDGSLYSGDLSQYVEIDDYTIKPTVLIEPDSKIYLYATTDVEHVKSNTLVIQVTRIPISSIHFISAGYKSYITAGESEKLFLEVFPSNATSNLLNEHLDITLLTPDIATLEYTENGWILSASSDYSAVYQQIKVQISAPNDGYSKIFEWTIDPIPIEKMTIINAETNAELDKITYLYRGDTLQLNAVIYPENASVGHVTYHDFSETTNYGAYISISDDGLLTVSENAPFDMEIDLRVTAIGKGSKMHKIIIKQRKVETYTISCETKLVEIGKMYNFSFSYTPSNAEILSRRYRLVEDVVGIYISGNMIYVSPDAIVGSKFQVICYCDGIESNILEFTVVESTE